MTRGERQVAGSPKDQGPTEEIAYAFDFASVGTPSEPSVKLIDLRSNEDISETSLDGDPGVAGDVVTAPKVKLLVPGGEYKLVCTATVSGNKVAYYLILYGEA